jgi:hypothetical protein
MRRAGLLLLALLALPSLSGAEKHPSLIVAGRVSTFGPPNEGPGRTANGSSSADPGIALRRHDTLGRRFCVTLHRGRLHAVLRHIDYGPATSTGRVIDVTGAGVQKLRGRGSFATDLQAHARLLPRHRGPEWRCGRA